MTMSAFPGLLARNSPLASLGIAPLATPGKVFFVHSGRGSDTNVGDVDVSPRATLAATLPKCSASRGDQIWLLPGHAETVATAGGLPFATAGVSVFGLGIGSDRPTLTFSGSTAATLLVTAAACRIANCIFDLTGIDALDNPLLVQAPGFQFTDNRVICASSTAQAVLALLTTAAADRLYVARNRFEGSSDAGMTAVVTLVGGDGAVIEDNDFYGAYGQTVGAIRSITTLCTNCNILRNRINNRTAGSTKAITMLTGSTGVIAGNMMQILSGTAPITGDAMSWSGGNYYSAAIATAGTLI